MGKQEEWEYIDKYPLMHHVEYGFFSDLAFGAGIDISSFISNGVPRSNSFAKLRKVLYNTLLPNRKINKRFPNPERLGERKIDRFLHTGKYLNDVLTSHKRKIQERGINTPYQIDEGITDVRDFSRNLAKLITQIVNDLEDLSKISKENLEILKDLCFEFYHIATAYQRDLKRYMAA